MEFKKLGILIARNNKLYFKDKLNFFFSLLTPIILIVLFLTFLGNIYKTSLTSVVGDVAIEESIVNVFASSWLFSSILATSCITVAFCSNIMVQDRINKTHLDFKITPTKKTTVQIGYFVSNFISTFIICSIVLVISLIYFLIAGWYFSFVDILLIFVNIILGVFMGSLVASVVMNFVTTQGALSAVCTLVSSMYGFLCGAYMPISQFSVGIQNFVGFIPGTYTTIIFRNYYMRGILEELSKTLPAETINAIKTGFDNNYSFFGTNVTIQAMFVIVVLFIIALFSLYILVVYLKNKKHVKYKKELQVTK